MSRDREFNDKLHNPRWDDREFRTPIRMPHRSSAIIDLISRWRQSGSTTCMVEGLKSQACALLVSSEKEGMRILRSFKHNERGYEIISYENIRDSIYKIDRRQLPMFIDNSFLLRFAEETGSQIDSLMRNENDLIARLEKAEQHKDYKYVQNLKQHLVAKDVQLFMERSSLKIQKAILNEYIKRSEELAYFYVQITLFLSLSFFIIVYLIYAFISIS